MLPLTLAEIAAAVGGTLHDADPQAQVTGLCTFDSRVVEPGGLYVALPGARVDGHDFAVQAIEAGAVVVLAARPLGVPAIVVEDTLAAYGRLATAIVARVPSLGVVGVTGSVGKTTTKDLIGQVLSSLGPTTAPPGNRNSESGMPENVSRVTADSRFLVLEMGARHVGDIAYLTSLVRPHVGVVLNVGTAHLGEFGSREAIAKAKGELVEALAADGAAVLNADDPMVAAMAGRTAAEVVTFGLGAEATVRAESVEVDGTGRASFTLRTPAGAAKVALRLVGEHLVPNALAAAAVALHFTDDLALIAQALSTAAPVSEGRMQVVESPAGFTVINDAYNAGPVSMTAALRTLTKLAAGRRAVAVLGQMNELGETSTADHVGVGAVAAEVGVDWLLTVGNDDAAQLGRAAAERGVATRHVPDRDAAREALAEQLAPGDVVLFKGSNSVGLMALATTLAAGTDLTTD
ncbi:UDP-N-acetylmuramoyl-tripeptide--D-alanyl-D-alanine ligase [Couchioplanes caeruleus]|uniref:UDP-N-acetylmuramoyl-tripeptide--D-alanyl-D-alanine ligase n=2 Tax=Couchioplanes caeruleus TaxID=56438 RepID=A0A1K0FDQ6_9ACTN|nr:UDP-N-acetylmuramoyl-tripeptide--D-alanyl-D-alanine ligase [Couchioplanes caeruleus]OJF10880.1 UDP-N-acetylmuramoyl-tripeptide--D-alanyl-D-alanine ligase [Couchioplanes caeruleus subsp. caeruleus]ROP32779.1 UDP-N-acetylmuramoyl-tripeptide--D-alanyl-D-alanine ligase [Couchioplanes caeruleus]